MEWVRELDRALDLYNANDDAGCIAYINSVLRDTTPGYPRTRYYALLASCLDDWREADLMRARAEDSFAHWCIFNRPSDSRSPRVGEIRDELRALLDELHDELKRRRPGDWIDYQLTWTETDAEERDAELAEALTEYEAEEAEGEEEDEAENAEAEMERHAELEEGRKEQEFENAEADIESLAALAEAEAEEGADLSPTTLAALFRDADREYDTRALARNKALETPKASQSESQINANASPKKKSTRIPTPTAASNRPPRKSRAPARFAFAPDSTK
ncbi:hypothetical protein KCU65_g8717, partial [Aureobasidium melanogenum]